MNYELRITNKIAAIFLLLLITFGIFGLVGVSFAKDCPNGEASSTCYQLDNPLRNEASDIRGLICLVLSFLSSRVMPPVAVFMALYASFLLLTSTGDPGKVSAARQVLVYTFIGAGVMLLAVPLVALVTNVLGSTKDFNSMCSVQNASSTFIETFIRLINWFSWFIAITSVAVGLYAGFLYMTAQGEPQKVSTAGKTLFYAVVGIVVAVLAFSIITIINGFIQ